MRRRAAASQAQRARRLLSQEAIRRSHRRGELIRVILEDETVPPLSGADPVESTGKRPIPV